MNINDYRRAMDRIAPDAKLKERIMNQTKRKYRPARRVFTVALAAALTAACLATVALAASPELRTAVLSFFHMEEREQVPNSSAKPEGPDVSDADIGQLVKAQYIKMDSYRYGYSSGLLNDLTWSEDWKTLLDYKFWEVKDNELIPVEVDMQASVVDITFNGIHYQGDFWWFLRDGQLDFFTGDNRAWDKEGEHAWDWNFSFVPDRTDVLLLRLSTGTQMEYREHSFLYHLDTGETEDLFPDVDPDVLAQSDGAVWSDDLRLALITGRASEEFPNGHEWLYDRETGTLTDVSALGGLSAEAAVFADRDTLILTTYTTSGEDETLETVTGYAYDIPSGTLRKTLDEVHYYHWWEENPYGAQLFGSRCVLIDQEGQVQVVDLKTGAQTSVEGFTFQKGDEFTVSPSRNKVLYFAMDPEVEGLGITKLGMIDLEKSSFIAFDREGYENLREGGICWESDNTISIEASTLDGETQYLLLYQF